MAARDAVGGIGPHGKAMGGRAAETGVGLAKGRWKRGRANEGAASRWILHCREPFAYAHLVSEGGE